MIALTIFLSWIFIGFLFWLFVTLPRTGKNKWDLAEAIAYISLWPMILFIIIYTWLMDYKADQNLERAAKKLKKE